MFCFIGLLAGIFLIFKDDEMLKFQEVENISGVRQFINLFTMHYWYLFLIWIFKLNPLTHILNYLIIFLKSVTVGIIFGILLKEYAIYGLGMFVLKMFIQIIIIYPVMFYLILSNNDNCQNKIIIVTLVTCFYSLIVTIL